MNDDQSLGTPDHEHDHEHDAGAHQAPPRSSYLTVDDVLASARLVERTASICLRADLTAELDLIRAELGTLVTPSGEVIGDDDEAGMDHQSNASRARELVERDQQVRRQMRDSMWHVRMRAMPSDEWTTFKKLWWPKAKGGDMTEFRTKIVAECAIEPPISETQFKELRKKLGSSAIIELSDTAYEACTEGGLDVPKSPNSWANLTQQ